MLSSLLERSEIAIISEMKPKARHIFQTACIILSLGLFLLLETELTIQNGDGLIWIQWTIKFFLGLISVILSLPALIKRRTGYQALLTITLIIFLFADTSINLNFLAGGILFSIGHLLLILFLGKKGGWEKKKIPVFLITYSIFLILNLCFLKRNGSLLTIGFCLYSLIISLLMAFSITFERTIRIGILLFVISDFLLMLNIGLGYSLWMGHIARFVYYLSILVLASTSMDSDKKDENRK